MSEIDWSSQAAQRALPHAWKGSPMKVALNLVGVVLSLMGVTWFFQGINLLPGSFMTGQIQWAYYGGIAVIIGVGMIVAASRRRP